ncbi:hypothetical protein G7054_g8988 [Neopestalotiopsis clavispora]|nr:hypothetical protein G7054_g8988 [Neopestalotiopsis clavispora]
MLATINTNEMKVQPWKQHWPPTQSEAIVPANPGEVTDICSQIRPILMVVKNKDEETSDDGEGDESEEEGKKAVGKVMED